MSGIVYLLCAATAFTCAALLLRGYFQTGARLLLWSGLCFVCLTLNNALVFIDLQLVPNVSLLLARNLAALLGMSLLMFGLIWDSNE